MIEETKTAPTQASTSYSQTALSPLNRLLLNPNLTNPEKRAILADWASDFRALPHHPGKRVLDDGSVLGIDEISSALKSLDFTALTHPPQQRKVKLSRYRLPTIQRFLGRRRDDDDDPPPAPATISPRPPPNDDDSKIAAYVLP